MKTELISICKKLVDDRITVLRDQLRDLVEGASNDSKSTAGDKHETARAMMQIEQEKLANQLNLTLAQEQSMQRVQDVNSSESIVNGSLVETNQGWIYISVPLGRVEVKNTIVMCLSAQSPLGMKLIGKTIGEKVQINAAEYLIKSIG